MNEKHITFENLKTAISPVKHLIDKKADWNELKNRPFYTDENGNIHTIDAKYIPFTGIKQGKGYYAEIFNHYSNEADGECSHAEGYITKASGHYSHTEGQGTKANSKSLNVIGEYNAEADDLYYSQFHTVKEIIYEDEDLLIQGVPEFNSMTGKYTVPPTVKITDCTTLKVGDCYGPYKGHYSDKYYIGYHEIIEIIGPYRLGQKKGIEVIAKYHLPYNYAFNRGKYIHIAGNGDSNVRSNAHTLDWEGNAWYAGDVYVGSTSGTNKDDGSKKLATEEYVNTKVNTFKGTPFIEGSGTTDSTAKTSAWVGSSDEITEYYDGLTIKYKIGVAGQSTVTLNINNLGAKTVYRFSTTKLTTQFPVGSIINLIYHTDLNGGCWITNDYDANTNTYQRVYNSDSKNVEYPITARYNTTTGETYYAEYGRYSTGVTLNPSTNTITATTFKGNLNGTATKATQDSHGNVIVDAYATKNYVQQEITSKTLTLTGLDADGISHTWTIYGVAQ